VKWGFKKVYYFRDGIWAGRRRDILMFGPSWDAHWRPVGFCMMCVTAPLERSVPMNEEDSQFPTVKSRQRIECKVIWGGIQNIDTEVTAGKFIGSIYSAASEGEQGGDIYFFGVCRVDVISRLAIADVVGHGEVVSEVSQYVYNSLKAHI
jgi:hypothetical protein